MIRITTRIALLIIAVTVLQSNAAAQEHFTEGPVVRITLIDIKPGKGADFWRDLRQNIKPLWEELKKAGILVDYSVSVKVTTDGPDDWDVSTALQYKNWAALDGIEGKIDPISLKHYGSAEARTAAGMKRLEFRTFTASFLIRGVTLKDLPK
jgi:hypothetical protein